MEEARPINEKKLIMDNGGGKTMNQPVLWPNTFQ
jgi:hypothetical protein